MFIKAPKETVKKRKIKKLAASDKQAAVMALSQMIKSKTVSNRNDKKTDWKEFEKFIYLLDKLFPILADRCKRDFIGNTGMVYTWKGASNASPILLTAHYDVVATGSGWSHGPFSGEVKDKCIWGRGALDTKGSMCAMLTAAELLIRADYTPKQTIYFAFCGDEEIGGDSSKAVAEWFTSQDITFQMVLDEGSSVTDEIIPGVQVPVAAVGIGEKGQAEIELISTCQAGHASAPPLKTSVSQLSKSIESITSHPLPGNITAPVEEMLKKLTPYTSFPYRVLYANRNILKPFLIRKSAKTGGGYSALFRTTCAITMLEASETISVLPQTSRAWADMRTLPGSTAAEALDHLKSSKRLEGIDAKILFERPATQISPSDGHVWEVLCTLIQDTFSDTIVCPSLMTARGDARNYESLSKRVYRFTPFRLQPGQAETIHGKDEYLTYEQLFIAISFYYRLMREI